MLHVGFFMIGIITVLIGQVLPILSLRLSLTDRESGYFFIVQFAGSLAGTLSYNRIIKKFGYPRMLFGGFCMMVAGCLGINLDSWFGCMAAVFLNGIGIGLTIPAINMLVVELNAAKSSSALNIVNFFWGLGAISCKPFIDFVGSPTGFLLPTLLLSFVLLSIGSAIGFSRISESASKNGKTSSVARPIWSTRTAWLIAIFGFLHIGVESSVGGWITTYESRLAPSSTTGWLSAAFIFFSFLVIGRGIAPLFFRFLSENTVLICSLVTMTGGMILILLTEDYALFLIGAAVLGFGCSSVFPTNMSRFTKAFGPQATQNATPIFVLGGLGGAFTTWFTGYVSTAFNSLRAGFLVILISCLLLLVLQIILTRVSLNNVSD